MEKLFESFKKLASYAAPSGHEAAFTAYLANEAKKYCDSVRFDKRGNLICRKANEGAEKLILAAHADEIGILAMYAEDNGYYRFAVMGGALKSGFLFRRVVFQNGVTGVILQEEGEKPEAPDINKMYIDIGAASKKEAEKMLPPCTAGVFLTEPALQGARLVSRAIDDKIGCLILLELMKTAASRFDLYFCFTVEEELGLRGARTVGNAILPDIAIAVDVSGASDVIPEKRKNIKLGGGAALKIIDRGIVSDAELIKELSAIAKKNKIAAQTDVAEYGRTDAAELQYVGEGVRAGVVSVPIRYCHTAVETADMKDVEAVIALLGRYIAK